MIDLENELLVTQIKLVNELHSITSLEKILIKMQPLVKKYSRKLYFMEYEDASQELNISLIESVYHLKFYKNDAMCLAYLQRGVINKYNYLCKEHIKLSKMENELLELSDEIPYMEDFQRSEISVDLYELLKSKSERQKLIAKCIFVDENSDKEIALKLGVSRQYINRVKKKLFNEIRTCIK